MIILGLILGMIAGVIINNMASADTAKSMQDISIFTTIFLRLVKMIIAPLVISTLVVGIAKMGDAKTLGRIFSKTFFLFICASLLSIALGLVIVNLFQPGAGINFVPHEGRGRRSVRALHAESVYLARGTTSIVDDGAQRNSANRGVLDFLGCSLAAIGEKPSPL
jgi:Na+/H+-dicarboxylate symporter